MSDLPERRSVRLQTYDYASAGAYFVTICVRQGRCVLGKIVNERMHTSLHGQIARDCWEEIPSHFPTVELDSFVVIQPRSWPPDASRECKREQPTGDFRTAKEPVGINGYSVIQSSRVEADQ